MLWLDEDESFSLSANVTSMGYQAVVLKGMMVKQVGGETYVHPLLPSFFYGASGEQLSGTWRQYISGTGEQTILSRVGGQPEPSEPLYWQKLKTPTAVQAQPARLQTETLPIIILGLAVIVLAAYVVTR